MPLTQNEVDLVLLVQELSKSKTHSETIQASLNRLLAQLPKSEAPVAVIRTLPAKAEKERLEGLKQPSKWSPPLNTTPADGDERRDFLETLKQHPYKLHLERVEKQRLEKLRLEKLKQAEEKVL